MVEPGFFIRKFKSGKATYGVKYVCRGQQRRITLGPVLPNNLESMRKLAGDMAAKARTLGTDEMEVRPSAAGLPGNPREGQLRRFCAHSISGGAHPGRQDDSAKRNGPARSPWSMAAPDLLAMRCPL